MRTLFLHVGHPKTGSSYLQYCFAENGDVLRQHGLVYPFDTEYIAGSKVSTGNGRKAFESLESLSVHLAAVPDDGRSVLLSSEFFISHMADSSRIPGMLDVARRYGFGQVSLLLLVREPMSMQLSMMRQHMKDTSEVVSPFSKVTELFLARAYCWHTYLEALQGHSGITATVRNYGRVRDRLVSVAEEWLGIPEGSLSRPTTGVVNRSLNADEVFFISSVKENMTPPYPSLGWPLVVRMPELSALPRWPSREVQEQICLQVQDTLEALNRYLPPDEPLVFDFRDPSPPVSEVSFQGAQLEAVGPELAVMWDEWVSPTHGYAWLRRWKEAFRFASDGPSGLDALFGRLSAAESMLGSIDLVGAHRCTGRTFCLSDGGRVEGWLAMDSDPGEAAQSVYLLWEPTDGRPSLYACQSVRRPDVAAFYSRPGLVWSGFRTMTPLVPGSAGGRLHLLAYHRGEMYHNGVLVWQVDHEPTTGGG